MKRQATLPGISARSTKGQRICDEIHEQAIRGLNPSRKSVSDALRSEGISEGQVSGCISMFDQTGIAIRLNDERKSIQIVESGPWDYSQVRRRYDLIKGRRTSSRRHPFQDHDPKNN